MRVTGEEGRKEGRREGRKEGRKEGSSSLYRSDVSVPSINCSVV